MHFAFDEDQLAFRDAVRDLLAKECPPEVVRAAWPDGTDAHGARPGDGARADADRVGRVWTMLADMGVLGIAVPEEHGGLGLTELDWVLLAEESGYAALPHPFVETVGVAAPLLAATGDRDREVAEVLAGTRQVAAVAVVDGGAAGTAPVPWADRADAVIVLRRDAAAAGWTADLTAADGPVAAVDGGRHVAVVDLSRAGAVSLGDPADAARAFERGALGTAAQLVGLGRRMLELTVGYVGERTQFGVPVGSQQAVKHHLADAALQLTFAAPAVHRAAWSLATGAPTVARDVSMAKAMASDAARLVVRKALQCHGAIGYTVEYDLHLFLKRAEALARAWGSAGWHRNRVATALGI
ncbi:MAG: acyl-CoA dehydrogenase domain protein [Acidimicrobiales bacterium]|nr:acyl-CoA dehydrogenase domain protein [Acidimicrobiales bacterium]